MTLGSGSHIFFVMDRDRCRVWVPVMARLDHQIDSVSVLDVILLKELGVC